MPITYSTIFHRHFHPIPVFPKMMNILALALILTSIATASFFSPPSDSNRQTICESHRLIVLQFERQIPQSSSFPSSAGEVAGETNKKPLDAGQDLSQPPKAKISSLFTDTKQKAIQLEESVSNTVKSAAKKLKHKASQIEETIKSSAEEAKKKATRIEESASVAFKTAAETALEAGQEVAGNISYSAAKTAESTKDIRRLAWEIGRDLAAFVSAGVVNTVRSAAAVIHLLGFATAYGTCVWVTFVSNHVLASAMPRQQFGMLQSRIYPVYFRFLGVAVGVALAGHVLKGKDRVQAYNLMAMLAFVLLNVFWLERKATKAMFERMKLAKEEGRGRDVADVVTELATPGAQPTAATTPLANASTSKKRLKSLNNYSSLLNVLTLMGLSWHLVSLA
ncbi:uncharacterized protein LOC110033633 [Phalaenopsis equestris]|uniref:uncharacterized protein LOC110033633 n=1 Tax=Phalaenopsis equestris TaxID=78828 RepID=UPI0009E1C78B|nr:uncharacterized protein LOC110033633 [Phalaenopsis equestris]